MRRGRSGSGGIAILMVVAALSGAPAALAAGSPTVNQGYPGATKPPAAPGHSGTPAGQANNNAAAGAGVRAAVAGTQHGALPFTGLQLGLFVALGTLLVAGGLVLRASGRRGPAS